MKKILLLFVGIVVCNFVLKSQNYSITSVNDTLVADATWSYDTIFVNEKFVISDDVVLTINPGTVIMFNDFYNFIVEGTLLSQGTLTDSIIYTVADTSGYWNFSHTGWDGIEFVNNGDMDDNDSSRFAYCAFYYGFEKYDWYGGGVFRILNYSKVIIENSLFRYNYAHSDDNDGAMGGAISIQNDGAPIISNCTFLDNNATVGGGAINIGCYDDENVFDQVIIRNCYFKNNNALYDEDNSRYGGGAVKISGYSDAYVVNCIFEENSSLTSGGAMLISGYAYPYIVNNLFVNNHADTTGGAVAIKFYAGGFHLNNTVTANYAGIKGGAYSIGCSTDSCVFVNNIIYGNTDGSGNYSQFFLKSDNDSVKFYNNNIEEFDVAYDSVIYVNNISADPLWVNPSNGNYNLQTSSPCKDVGLDTLDYFPQLDLAGNPRLYGSEYDMGAYENQPGSFIAQNNFELEVSVFPNPTSGIIKINSKDLKIKNVEIIELTGKIVQQLSPDNSEFTIDISNFENGIYIMKIQTENKIITTKIIKK